MKITTFGWVVITLAIVILTSLVGAIYFESTGDYIKTSTHATWFQFIGEPLGVWLHDLGHSLMIGWIFVGVMFFVVTGIIIYIKTRPQESTGGYYDYYRY